MERRRVAECQACGELRELATKSECYRCYRAREREEKSLALDSHTPSPAARRQQKRLWRGYTAFVSALHDMHLPEDEIQKHIDMVRDYLAPIHERLPPAKVPRHAASVNVNTSR